MNSKSLVICDRDRDYCAALAEYIRLSDCGYEVMTYTDPGVFCPDCSGREISILLIQEDFYAEVLRARSGDCYNASADNNGMFSFGTAEGGMIAGRQFILTENREDEDADHIYKYQSAACIVSAIGDDIRAAHRIVKDIERDTGMQLIGVYSPLSHTLKTTFSLTLGQILGEYGPVLYMNMEGYNGLTQLFDLRSEYSLADLVYEYSLHPDELSSLLARYTVKVNELHILLPARSPFEIQETEPSMWLSLIGTLAETGRFGTVILDISDAVRGAFDILNVCTDIYMPVRKDAVAMAKLKDFDHVLSGYPDAENIRNRLKKLKFPYFEDMDANIGGLKNSRLGRYIRQEIISGKAAKERETEELI